MVRSSGPFSQFRHAARILAIEASGAAGAHEEVGVVHLACWTALLRV